MIPYPPLATSSYAGLVQFPLTTAQGGLGANNSASTGVPLFTAGVVAFQDWLDQSVKVAATPQWARAGFGNAANSYSLSLTPATDQNGINILRRASGANASSYWGIFCQNPAATDSFILGQSNSNNGGPLGWILVNDAFCYYPSGRFVWGNTNPTITMSSGNNIQLGGTSTPASLAAAATDTVSRAGVDNGAGNREDQVQPESGGKFAWGNNQYRRVPSANQDVFHWTPSVNTTDATQTTLATIPITASRTYFIEARVAARRTGGASGTADDGASYIRQATYTTKSGTVTLMGSVQTIGTDAEDQAGWDITLTISGTNVLVRVTGASANNVTWMGDITVQSVAS